MPVLPPIRPRGLANFFDRSTAPAQPASLNAAPLKDDAALRSEHIQPSGFLLALSSDWVVTHVSANAPRWVGLPVEAIIGSPLHGIMLAKGSHTIRNCVAALRAEAAAERIFGVPLFADGALFDIAVHLTRTMIIVECQPRLASDGAGSTTLLGAMINRLRQTEGVIELCREATRQIRAITSFERVMIHKFHPDQSGEVIAETIRSGLRPLLGLRYPPSVVPSQLRALYARNWLRIIGDVEAEMVPILPLARPDEAPLDLSFSMLRSAAPEHADYLRTIGVMASLTISIIRDGKLWGLIACYHSTPRAVGFERRTVAELFGQVFSLLLEGREREREAAYERDAQAVHQTVIAALAADPRGIDGASALLETMRTLIPCDGIGTWLNEQPDLAGSTPPAEAFAALMHHLDHSETGQVVASTVLGTLHGPAAAYADCATGMLAIPLARAPRDYIVFFRRRQGQLAGGPPSGNPPRPGEPSRAAGLRASVHAWRDTLQRQAPAWSAAEIRVAERLRAALLEQMLHAFDQAAFARRSAVSQQKLLVAELNHRVRNIFGLVQGLVARGRTDARSVDDYAEVLGTRLQALARAHDLALPGEQGRGVASLIATESAAYADADAERVRCTGPAVTLTPQASSTLALVLHELMTNAAKYGALHAARGHVTVDWTIDPAGDLVLHWHERCGQAIQPPTRRGFGSTLIEQAILHELAGETAISYAPDGLRVRLMIPARFITGGVDATPVAARGAAPLLTGNVLLLEDNLIVALGAEEMLLALGAAHVDVVGRVDEALALIRVSRPDYAVLDVSIGSETSYAVAEALRMAGVPHCFATGYGDEAGFPESCIGTPLVEKPYALEALNAAIQGGGRRVSAPPRP